MRKRTTILLRLLPLGLLWAGLTGCGTRQVVTQLKLPPRVQEMGSARTIDLSRFSGTRSRQVQQTMSQLIQMGRLHRVTAGSADVRVEVDVHDDSYRPKTEVHEDRRCVSHDKKSRCTKYVKVPIYTLTERCTVSLEGRIMRADGQQLLSRTFAGERENIQRSNKGVPSGQPEPLCAGAAEDAVRKFAAFVTPVDTQVALDYHTITGDGDRTERGIELAGRGLFAQAKAIFSSVADDTTQDAETRGWSHYNLAVTLWALAEFDACKQALDRAAESISASEVQTMRATCAEYLQ